MASSREPSGNQHWPYCFAFASFSRSATASPTRALTLGTRDASPIRLCVTYDERSAARYSIRGESAASPVWTLTFTPPDDTGCMLMLIYRTKGYGGLWANTPCSECDTT